MNSYLYLLLIEWVIRVCFSEDIAIEQSASALLAIAQRAEARERYRNFSKMHQITQS